MFRSLRSLVLSSEPAHIHTSFSRTKVVVSVSDNSEGDSELCFQGVVCSRPRLHNLEYNTPTDDVTVHEEEIQD